MDDYSSRKTRSPLDSPGSNCFSPRTPACATSPACTPTRKPTFPTEGSDSQLAEQKVYLPQLPHPSPTSPWSWMPMSPSFYATSPLYYPASGVRYSTAPPVFPSHQPGSPSFTRRSVDSRSWASVSPSRRPRWLNHHPDSQSQVPRSPGSQSCLPISRSCQIRSREYQRFSPYQRPSTTQQDLASCPRRRHQHNTTHTPHQPLPNHEPQTSEPQQRHLAPR